MSKSILVIDTPKSCSECPCYDRDYPVCCVLNKETRSYAKRPNWCPLKSMPQRKKVGEIEEVDDFMKSDIQIINEKVTAKIMLDTELLLASGYNLCIDEIFGAEEK